MATKSTSRKRSATSSTSPRSMPKAGKNPRGGLTAKGRRLLERYEAAHKRSRPAAAH